MPCVAVASCSSCWARGDLENKLHALRLELREGRLADSVQHVQDVVTQLRALGALNDSRCLQEKGKYEESMNEELERLRPGLVSLSLSLSLCFVCVCVVWSMRRLCELQASLGG